MDQADSQYSEAISPGPRRHDGVSMTLHWLTLVLLVVLFGAIWAREQASDRDTAALLLMLHRSAGVLIWVVTLTRLAWKATAARAAALPRTMSRAQRWAARANEYALYFLLAVQPVTGFVQSIARGRDFPMLGASVPVVMARNKVVARLFHDIHETSATLLLVLVGLHACAAMFHGAVLHDGVLGSMLPAWKRTREK